jgi:hypothetical protein
MFGVGEVHREGKKLDLYGYLRRPFDSIPGARSVEHFERLLPFQQPGDTA